MTPKRTKSFFNMQFVTATISTTMVLLLLGMVLFFVLCSNNLSTYVKENLVFSIIISDDMKENDILALQRRLDAQPFVRTSAYISKKQALKEYSEAMGTDPQEFLGFNPLKASIQINLHSDYANTDSLAVIEQQIKENTDIHEINYQRELIDAVNKNIARISLMLLALAAVLTLISFALINNTIRLTIYSQRFLIHTMKLVGATWGFIRRPFLRRNFWIGLCSSLLADGVLWGVACWVLSRQPELVSVISVRVMVLVSIGVLLFGILITWLCAYFSINKFLKMKATTLYYI